jgi:peroxiredoxin
MSPTLQSQLADFKAGFAQRATPERVATMEAATAQLKATGIERTALQAGARLPQLSLPNARGNEVSLQELNQTGPLVIVFYRGGWCPYCNLELRAWQEQLPAMKAAGISLVAISPQTPDNSLNTQEKNALQFEVLSDSSLEASRAFGVLFDMPQELVDLYSKVGHDLPVTNGNGNGRWSLPVPATYVVGKDGLIAQAYVDADYRNRAEPAQVLATLLSGK